jgi:hypothetical protein
MTTIRASILFALAILITRHVNAAILTGSVSPIPANVNLTAEGPIDWIHWGLVTENDINRKATGLSQISDFSTIGSGTSVVRLTDSPSKYSWFDGSPNPTVVNTASGVYINNFDGPGRGFIFTVPADLLARVLKVYVGEFAASGTLAAALSDNSAPPYMETLVGVPGQTVQGVYTINYMAASPGETLTIRWTETSDLGNADNITLQAAALSLGPVIPEPAALALIWLPVVLLARRHRA